MLECEVGRTKFRSSGCGHHIVVSAQVSSRSIPRLRLSRIVHRHRIPVEVSFTNIRIIGSIGITIFQSPPFTIECNILGTLSRSHREIGLRTFFGKDTYRIIGGPSAFDGIFGNIIKSSTCNFELESCVVITICFNTYDCSLASSCASSVQDAKDSRAILAKKVNTLVFI